MADLSPITSWTLADVLHFGRRAGFGLNPTDAATLQALAPGAAIDAWIDGTGTAYDATAFTAAPPSAASASDRVGRKAAVMVPSAVKRRSRLGSRNATA